MPRTSGVQPTPFNLRITLSGGTKTERTFVKVVNTSTNEYREVLADENSAGVNLADLSSDGTSQGAFSGFTNGDKIEIRCHGGRMGSTIMTVDTSTRRGGNSVTVTVVDVTATNVPRLEV